MKFTIIVARYAKALLDAAVDNNTVDKTLEELKFVNDTIEGSKELSSLLSQPFVSNSRKIKIFEKLFKDKVSSLTLNFMRLMIDKNRETALLDIYDKFYELYLEYKKIAIVTITSAVALDDVTQQRMVNIIRHKIEDDFVVKINNVIDRDIIGGFIVNYKDFHYDASVKGSIKRLHDVFSENLFVKGF
ncbi:MAG: ATP synthase F1 subunit delta [Lentimicrobiaceae bacterium]|nr:ATP synthase F1 subunit delta [Lentimicrobiaceae bacterium]